MPHVAPRRSPSETRVADSEDRSAISESLDREVAPAKAPSDPAAPPRGGLLRSLEQRLDATMRSVSARKLVRALGAIIALFTAIAIPVGYAIVGYLKDSEALAFRAELGAARLASGIPAWHADWQRDLERLQSFAGATDSIGSPAARRILDANGSSLLIAGPSIARPTMVRSAPIVVGGSTVGHVELTASLLPLLTNAAMLGLLTLFLGGGAYLIFAVLPLKVLDRSLGELTEAGARANRQNMLLDTALGTMVQGLAMYDADERIVIANDRYAEIYGLSPEQVRPGTTLRQVVAQRAALGHYPDLSVDEAYQKMRARIQRAEPSHILNKLADGRVVAAFVQPRASGGWVVTHQDVTERENLHALLAQQNTLLRQGEEQLKEHNRALDAAAQDGRRTLGLLDVALNNMTQGLCMFDARRQLVVCNRVYIDMYGLPADKVKPGCTWEDVAQLREEAGFQRDKEAEQAVSDWLASGRAELRRIQPLTDGRIISIRRRRLPDGGYVVTHEDTTERYRLEQNEREARELLSAVFDAAPAAIICLDLEGQVMVWSRGAERMFGYTADETVGYPYPLVPDGKEDEFDQLFKRALAGEIFREAHVQRRHKDGRLLDVSFASAGMFSRDGSVRGMAYALTDISEGEKLRKQLKEQHEQLDVALNNTSHGIAMFDPEQHLVVCNNLYARMFDLSPAQIKPGTTLSQILEYRQANGCHDVRTGAASPRAGTYAGMRSGVQRLANDRIIQVSCRRTTGGGHVITHQDITESEQLNARLEQQHRQLKEQEEQLRAQNLQLDAALNNMVQGLAMFDADRRLVICNRRFAEMYDLTEEQTKPGTALDTLLDHRFSGGSLTAGSANQIAQSMLGDADAHQSGSIVTELSDGRFIAVSTQPMAGGGILTTHQDITEQRRSEAKIVHMALHDTLTNLPNRMLLSERLEHALTRVKRGEMVAIQMLDLDYFKSVNDTLGHAAGDRLLQMVAERLHGLVRETDTVARVGGDEFAILQVAINQPSDATSLAHRVIDVVCKPYDIDGHQVVIGTSVGIAMGPADGVTPEQLTKNADLALYRAKGDGRGTFCFFEPEMDAEMQARRAMEYDLRKALAAGEFELHYQPIVNLGSDDVTGMEALIRWHHPKRGMIPPSMFIPLAEEIGFIVPLGEWALRQACLAAARWPEPLTIAVNISPAQFRNPGLLQMVIGALVAADLPPARLELEITEKVLLSDNEATLGTLYQLRDLGVHVAMDDFGTGYSSLNYLQSFPFDKIKIDRSFVSDITEGAASLNIVRAVTAMAHGLGMITTAEGVETSAQLEAVRAEGCTEMQGYLFSHPLPEQESLAFLHRRMLDRDEMLADKSAA